MSLVTVADEVFLPQALALGDSLRTHWPDAHLTVVALSDQAYRALTLVLDPESCSVVNLRDVLLDEYLDRLASIPDRAAFAWASVPCVLVSLLEARDGRDTWTYVDADMYFLKHPTQLLSAFTDSGMDAMLTPHGYAPEFDQTATSGYYCVQFLPVRSAAIESFARPWAEATLAGYRGDFVADLDSAFPDQGYLDRFRFSSEETLAELGSPGLILGPWNMTRYPYSEAEVCHFQGVRLLAGNKVLLGDYPIPRPVLENLYAPYVRSLSRAVLHLRATGVEVPIQSQTPSLKRRALRYARWLRRSLRAHYSVQMMSMVP